MNNLKSYRIKNGYTLEQVGKYLKISGSAYRHYENGKNRISAQMLLRLSDFYGVSVDELLGGVNGSGERKLDVLDVLINRYALDDIDIAVLTEYLTNPANRINMKKALIGFLNN